MAFKLYITIFIIIIIVHVIYSIYDIYFNYPSDMQENVPEMPKKERGDKDRN